MSAIEYAAYFAEHLRLQVVPLYGVAMGPVGGICRCREAIECSSPGKHPKAKWKGQPSLLPTKYENYAVVLDRYIVVDIDDRSILEVSALEEIMGFGLPETWSVDTNRGRHLWFEHSEVLAPRIGAWHKIDLKTGPTYVVGPGSTSVSGLIYEPINALPIAAAPDELVAACGKPRITDGSAFVPEMPSAMSTFAIEWLDSLCDRIRTTSTRNNELLRVTCEAIRSGVVDESGIARLADAAREAGLSDREIERTQDSARRLVQSA